MRAALPFSLIRRISFRDILVLAAAVGLAAGFGASGPGVTALAQGTRVWTQTRMEEFEKGTPQGVAITSDGKLRAGPTATELLTTPSSFVWSVAVGKAGAVFLGTGSPATVLRFESKTESTKIFETKALAVEVVRVGPDGMVYAATIPDGRVYRLKSDGAKALDDTTAEVVFDLAKEDGEAGDGKGSDAKKARYIWDMTFDSAGRLYVATGGPAGVYRVDVSGSKAKVEGWFKTDEQHVRSLAWDKSGNLIAGTDGSGLVYRIDPSGKGYVLFSAPRREVTSVAVGADGVIYAADVGDKAHNPLPQLPVASGGGGITITFVQPGSVTAANASTALPDGSEIYAIKADQAPRKIWSDKDAVVYALAAEKDGLTVLTGNRGRIYRIHDDGSFVDIAHLDAQQAVAIAETAGGWLVGTGNTGKLIALGNGQSSDARRYAEYPHVYGSDVLDAGAVARWGRMEVDPESRGFKLWTRSGNVEQPARKDKDWGWSDWRTVEGERIASPAGRYLQWKVELEGDAQVGGVGVNYLPVNSAPVVDEVAVVPGARFVAQNQAGQPPMVTIGLPSAQANAGVSFDAGAQPIQGQKDRTAVTVRWAAHDEDGDELTYDLFLRGDGETRWLPLKKGLTEKVYSFDATAFPDGGYRIKVVASDAASHSPGGALTGDAVSERFELDTTAPVISELKAGAAVACGSGACAGKMAIPVGFVATDAFSAVSHAEVSVDGGPWQYVEPVGGLSDAREERYSVMVPLAGDAKVEHLITVRAYDRHENMGTGKVVVVGSGR